MSYTETYMELVAQTAAGINPLEIESLALGLAAIRNGGGRVFCIGNGGGAGNASHAASDLRKLAEVQAYAFDNMSELTARINDEGWQHAHRDWLESHLIGKGDALIVFSVGGGDGMTVSWNLTVAAAAAHFAGADVYAIVGARGKVCDYATQSIVIEVLKKFRTPIVESFQAVIWHAIVTHPALVPGASW